MRRAGSESAFTFIELMAVMTLIVIAVGIALFNVDGLDAEARLGAGVRNLANTFDWARAEAAVESREIQVELDLSNHRYRVIVPPRATLNRGAARPDDERDLEIHPWDLLPRNVRLERLTVLGDDRPIDTGTYVVSFAATGTSTTFVLTITSDDIEAGRRQTPEPNYFWLEVNGFTGSTLFQMGKPPEDEDAMIDAGAF